MKWNVTSEYDQYVELFNKNVVPVANNFGLVSAIESYHGTININLVDSITAVNKVTGESGFATGSTGKRH